MTEIDKQERTNREIGLESIVESMYTEGCGRVHAPTKRKKKVKEADNSNVKKRTSALFKRAECDKCKGDGNLDDGSECKKCGGDGWIDAKDVVKEAGDPSQNTAGYIQIDLYTGGVQTISPDSVNQAIEGLKHVPAGEGESDWDAWTGEEYMIVAVPKTVHWPQTQAYDFADKPTAPISSPARQSQSPHTPSGMGGLGM